MNVNNKGAWVLFIVSPCQRFCPSFTPITNAVQCGSDIDLCSRTKPENQHRSSTSDESEGTVRPEEVAKNIGLSQGINLATSNFVS